MMKRDSCLTFIHVTMTIVLLGTLGPANCIVIMSIDRDVQRSYSQG
ncbi:MAG: hypothetical protein ACOX44_13875 [Limnochordia bacterium]|jgi:hypothetical protein